MQRITKSKYVSFYECPKRYYLETFHKELKRDDPNRDKILKAGTSVGDLAMGLFGSYIDVTTTKNEILDIPSMLEKTKEELSKGTLNICEASFLLDDLYCAVDIHHKNEDDTYSIYEVKSTTKVEDYHIIDTSFQAYVLKSLGLNIKSSNVVTIDSSYIRYGELDIHKLFKITDITDKVELHQAEIPGIIEKIRECRDNGINPQTDLSKACDKPYTCSFKDYCFKDLPDPSCFSLSSSRKKLDFYKEGLISFQDLYNSKYFKKMTEANQDQILYEIKNLEPKVDKERVKEFLSEIKYPLYLLDFESMQPAVPLFSKTKPYQQVVFQYSLHIMTSPHAKPIHKEFLAEEGKCPTRAVAESLIKDIPADSMLMAYNISFEKSRIKELSMMYPDLADELLRRLNFIDLMVPFKEHYVYKREFKGSYSIKYILPGLFPNDPELDYHNLNLIHNGSEAMNTYENLMDYSKEERLEIRECLLRYCELDTYAMVKILNKLYELVE